MVKTYLQVMLLLQSDKADACSVFDRFLSVHVPPHTPVNIRAFPLHHSSTLVIHFTHVNVDEYILN